MAQPTVAAPCAVVWQGGGKLLIDMARMVAVAVLAGVVGVGSLAIAPPVEVRASEDAPRAVIIVGPSSSSTAEYLDEGDLFADQAEAAGMDVTRIFHPRATWERVVSATRDANLVVYFGHGNGWPSPYPPFQERTKDGFGLNGHEGASQYSTTYYGGDSIRAKLRLAEDALVILYRSCYSAGNGEEGQAIPSRNIAVQRVDNFAAAFLSKKVGGAAVMAYRTKQWVDYAAQLMKPDRTMDDIFRKPSSKPGWFMSGWIGEILFETDSERTPGARIRLDEDPKGGFSRAITGRLGMTTDEWRGASDDDDDDDDAPQLGRLAAVAADTFSPNGDGVDETITLEHSVSEPAWVDIDVTDGAGAVVRRLSSWSAGEDSSSWDGRGSDGHRVADGSYRLVATARDGAGNRSDPMTVDVTVLTALREPAWSTAALAPADGDSFASSARFGTRLTKDASVDLRVEDDSGGLVRTLIRDADRGAGPISATWNGSAPGGEPVQDGRYHAVVSATTELGTISHRLKVWVGPFRIGLSDPTPRRGQRIRFTVRSTESLAAAPRLTIKQAGLAAYDRSTSKSDKRTYQRSVTLKSGGSAGVLRITVTGTDKSGQEASYTKERALR